MENTLHYWDYILIAGYGIATLGMGAWLAGGQRSTEDFFVGGRTLPPWAVGISLLASVFSTITYLGLPGEMFRSGIGYLSRELGIIATWCVVWFITIPFFCRLPVTSAYEYLEYRFNYATRVLAALLCVFLLVGWMAVAVVTASRAIAEIVRWSVPWSGGSSSAPLNDVDILTMIVLVGGFSLVYTTLGGLRAVVWTDVLQFSIMLSGAIFSIIYISISTRSTPMDWWLAWQQYPYREATPWFSSDVGQRSSLSFIVLGMTFWMVCTYGSNQIAIQRYLAVGSIGAARRSYIISVIANLSLAILLAAVGYALLYFVLSARTPIGKFVMAEDHVVRIAAQDAVFPQFIRYHMPVGLRGLVVAALIAAAMSTIDSGANSLATLVMNDILRQGKGRAGGKRGLRMARTITGLASAGIIVLSCGIYYVSKTTDIITLCQKGFNCFLGPLGGIFVLAFFCRRATPVTVIPAGLFGTAVGVVSAYSRDLTGVDFSTHLVIPSSCLATIMCGWCVSWLLGGEDENRVRWMWSTIVQYGCPGHSRSDNGSTGPSVRGRGMADGHARWTATEATE